jgi:hypothetical protein
VNTITLLHPDLPDLIDAYLRRSGHSWQQLQRGDLQLPGGEPLNVDSLQWWLLCADPVLWVESNLFNRPEDGGGFWQLFPYQRPSLRFRGHVVHQDGAEVGKSREIVGLILWGSLGVARGSILVGSALDGDLDEIWEEVELQLASNPFLRSQLRGSTTKPYRRLTWRNELRVLFRPAGHDGRAYRGVHVRGWLLHDEAAKVVNPRSWAEFWRAAKPDCEIRIYSVPTGDRLGTFQRIADSGVPADQVVFPDTPAAVIEQLLRPGAGLAAEAARTLARELGGRSWVRFHWPKTIMPAPFWSEERRQVFIALFGGPDDPGYVHNVLGLPGDPEFSVFPERLLRPALTWIPDYLSITLRWDSRAGALDALSRRLNPSYPWVDEAAPEEDGAAEDANEADGDDGLQPYLTVLQESLDVSGWDQWGAKRRREVIADLARAFVRPLGGDLTVGVDVASSSVTEIVVQSRALNPFGRDARTPITRDALLLRLHLTGWNWYAQRDLLLELDSILRPAGWGIDATGVGRVLCDLLAADLRDRLSGYVFNRSTAAIDPDTGEAQVDPASGRQVLITYKELGTQLLERRFHAREIELPFDPEVRHLLANHTYSQPGEARRYSKVNDHLVDALRCAELRKLTAEWADVAPPPVYAVPPGGATVDAHVFLKDY